MSYYKFVSVVQMWTLKNVLTTLFKSFLKREVSWIALVTLYLSIQWRNSWNYLLCFRNGVP